MHVINGPALVTGRFQPLHYGHAEYITEALKFCTHLYIGITHPDPGRYYQSDADRHRSSPDANPFPYDLRVKMVRDFMNDRRVHESEYDIVPIRLESADDCRKQVPPGTTVFVTIYGPWGREKKEIFEKMGFPVEVLWERQGDCRLAQGMDVRERIREDAEWDYLVPPTTYDVVKEWQARGGKINSLLRSECVSQ